MRYIGDFLSENSNTSFAVWPILSWEEESVLQSIYLWTGCSYAPGSMIVQCLKCYKDKETVAVRCG